MLRVLFILSLGFSQLGCDETDASRGTASAPNPSTRPVRSGTAVIRGTVSLSGRAPVMQVLRNEPCHPGAKPIRDETVVVSAEGRLGNVIVYVENAPGAPAAAAPAVSLDQADCRYVPHVVALRTGQTLHVTSSDPTLHNVHGTCTANEPFNFATTTAGQARDLTFAAPELFAVRCDVHPWMKAWVRVFDHPWFAVTREDGSFEIRDVPAGQYTLVAWHEKYGELRTQVTASDGNAAVAAFTFQSGL